MASEKDKLFLPNFCEVGPIFAVVVLSELLALMISVARVGFGPDLFSDLALISLYVQWLSLTSAAVLCVARGFLASLDERQAAIVSYLMILGINIAICEVAWWVINPVIGEQVLMTIAHQEFVLRTLAVSGIFAALVLRYFYVQHHWQKRIASEASARLEALQARIRPHFLFNCLNTIASLTRQAPEKAEQATEDLADLFRASLSDAGALATIDEEISFVERYLNIERLRLGERLQIAWQLEHIDGEIKLPRLTLQPLVENAIYHGIEPSTDGGTIEIHSRIVAERLEFVITNPVSGNATSGNRMAQDNVRQRLAAHFGEDGGLDIEAGDSRYQARVFLPVTP
ncbi:MAG: histidine kinase [Pseudomonadota bacterium]